MSFLTLEQKHLAEEIARLLVERHQTVAVMEASCGGLISAALLSIPGASAYFLGGGVLYTLASRHRLAGIPQEQLADYRGPTPEGVMALAEALRQRLDATWGLGESGVAGPAPSRYGKPIGYTAIAVVGPVAQSQAIETGLSDRETNMIEFTTAALRLFLEALQKSG